MEHKRNIGRASCPLGSFIDWDGDIADVYGYDGSPKLRFATVKGPK